MASPRFASPQERLRLTLATAQTKHDRRQMAGQRVHLCLSALVHRHHQIPESGRSAFDVDILDNIKMAFMGSLDVHNGRWGVFNDFLYLDLGNSKSGTRDFTLGNNSVPVGLAANLDMDLKGTVWTVAGEYRLPTGNPDYTIDLLAGTRLFTLKTTLDYTFTGTAGSHPLVGHVWPR